MDWSKAKTILIWAFLLLDLFLGFQVYTTRSQQWMNTDGQKSESWDLDLYLKQQNITLLTEIPQETPEMKYLNVEYLGFAGLFNQPMPGQRITLEKTAISSVFQQPVPIHDIKNLDDVLRELGERVMNADNYHSDAYLSTKDKLTYWQMHGKYPLFVAPLELFLENNTVKKYRQTYLHIRNQGSGRQVISAYTALRSLVENEIIKPGEKIESASLGYYGYYYDAEIQVLAPVWRFIHDGKTHYINGLTGAIERPSTDKNAAKQ